MQLIGSGVEPTAEKALEKARGFLAGVSCVHHAIEIPPTSGQAAVHHAVRYGLNLEPAEATVVVCNVKTDLCSTGRKRKVNTSDSSDFVSYAVLRAPVPDGVDAPDGGGMSHETHGNTNF
jgi:hypothetical protein